MKIPIIEMPINVHGELPKPKSLDWALVVPSFREGLDIFKTLSEGLTQIDVDPEKMAVFVVVNNARDASAEVLESNAQTIYLVKSLQRRSILKQADATELSESEGSGDINGDEMEAQILQRNKALIESQVRLILIDISSEGYAPDECNVGLAKNLGGCIATDALRDDGVLTITDADTLISQNHARACLKTFEDDSDLAGLRTIHRTFIVEDDEMLAEDISQNKWALYHLIGGFLKATSLHYEESPFLLMSGPNINVRAKAFKAIGGIEHIAGAEDMTFSMRLLDNGHKIVRDETLEYHSRGRVSDRTPKGFGCGQEVIDNLNHLADYGKAQVDSFEQNRFIAFMSRSVQGANFIAQDEETWRRMVRMASPFDIELDDEDIDVLWEAYRKAPNVKEIDNHWFLIMCIKDIAKKHLENSTLDDEAVAIYERIKSSDLVSPIIKSLIEKLKDGLAKLNEIRERLVADEERLLELSERDGDVFSNVQLILWIGSPTSVMRKKHADLQDCNYVVAEMFTLWRKYEEKVAFFENLLERFETFNGNVWPDMARPEYREVLSGHLDIAATDIPDAKDVVKGILTCVNIQRERALFTAVIELLKSRLDSAHELVKFLEKNSENQHLMDIVSGINDIYDELRKCLEDLNSQLKEAVGVIFVVPHAAQWMRTSTFLTDEEYGQFIRYSSLTS